MFYLLIVDSLILIDNTMYDLIAAVKLYIFDIYLKWICGIYVLLLCQLGLKLCFKESEKNNLETPSEKLYSLFNEYFLPCNLCSTSPTIPLQVPVQSYLTLILFISQMVSSYFPECPVTVLLISI